MAVTQDAEGVKIDADPEISPKALKQFYLRTLARGFARQPRRQLALDAMLAGKRPGEAAVIAGIKRQSCSQILNAFRAFAERESKKMKARRVVAIETEQDDLTEMQVLERLLELEPSK